MKSIKFPYNSRYGTKMTKGAVYSLGFMVTGNKSDTGELKVAP